MPQPDVQLGGGYTYQWRCAILLALNYLYQYQPVSYNQALHDLVTDFLGAVDCILLEGERLGIGENQGNIIPEDINLLGRGLDGAGEPQVLIQVKVKQTGYWTPSDPDLRKALYRFSRNEASDRDDTRFVFLTNQSFNDALERVRKQIEGPATEPSQELWGLVNGVVQYAAKEHGRSLDPRRVLSALRRTILINFMPLDTIVANVQAKLQGFGRGDWGQTYDTLFSRFAELSERKGGSRVTRATLTEILGEPPRDSPNIERFRATVENRQVREALDLARELLEGEAEKRFEPGDMARVTSIVRLVSGDFSEALAPSDFSTWPDTWAGAMIAASEFDKARQRGAPENKALQRYMFMLPLDLLSKKLEAPFRSARARIGLEPSQSWRWPETPEGRSPIALTIQRAPGLRLSIQRCHIFPYARTDHTDEQRLLFSESAGWYWPHHPLHIQLSRQTSFAAVWGEAGTGKTALGLALGQYQHAPRTFGWYLSGTPTIDEIQRAAARTLLAFVRKHLTWLCLLDRSSRKLLAGLWLSVLDRQLTLSQLEQPAHAAPLPLASQDDALHQAAWEAHARSEARLMQQTVRRHESRVALPTEDWFAQLYYCTDLLGFDRRRLVVDVCGEGWLHWLDQTSALVHLSISGATTECDLVLLLPDAPPSAWSKQDQRFDVQQLRWQGSGKSAPLISLLRHRCIRFGLQPHEISRLLAGFRAPMTAAIRSPARLAQVWRYLSLNYGSANIITEKMVNEAAENAPGSFIEC